VVPRMKIVMVDSHAEIERGGAIQCARLATALAQRGHEVLCVFDEDRFRKGDSGPYWRRMREAGVTVERYGLRSIAAVRRFRRRLAGFRPDIVHTHKNRALYFVAGATVGRRDFGWVANRGTEYSLGRGPAWAIHKLRVERMVAVAEAVRQQLIRDGIEADKVRTIYGSFDVDRFDPATSGTEMRRAWDVPESAPLVGMAASFKSRKKGQDDFLRAAAQVLREQPEAWFVLAGDGSAGPLRRLAQELGIAQRVRFPGFVSDMPAALAAMDVVVCASTRGEGLTGSIREALAMARPVVSTDVAGNRELVRNGETGLLTPVRDPARLAEAITELLADPERAAAMGAAGRKLVLELCTDEVRAAQVEQVYRELLEDKARRSAAA
jgi:glycosyltransferase involved in cell wall biosynthesis